MKNSAIQWTDHSFNSWEGCTKVAPECKNCYAEKLVDHRFGRAKWGKGQPRRRTSANLWKGPLAWNREPWVCDKCGIGWAIAGLHPGCDGEEFHRARVFCLSLGDWLDEEVPIEWLRDLLILIHSTPNLEWQLLTKRPKNWRSRIQAVLDIEEGDDDSKTGIVEAGGELGWALKLFFWLGNSGVKVEPFPNIWIGVSAGADIEAALDIPAKIHFLSCEPMLHSLDTSNDAFKHFDWIIFGGESGKNAREFKVDWLRMGVAYCRANKIQCFVKQMGRNVVDRNDAGFDGDPGDWPMGTEFRELETGYQGAPVQILLNDSHGGTMDEWPDNLRIRQIP